MKIVGFGDSFVYGSELKQETHSWVSQCAEKLECEYETTSVLTMLEFSGKLKLP